MSWQAGLAQWANIGSTLQSDKAHVCSKDRDPGLTRELGRSAYQ